LARSRGDFIRLMTAKFIPLLSIPVDNG